MVFGTSTLEQQEFYLKLLQKAMHMLVQSYLDHPGNQFFNQEIMSPKSKMFKFQQDKEKGETVNSTPSTSSSSFCRHMTKIYKYLAVIDQKKDLQIKFSEVLRPLFEHLKKVECIDPSENKSTFSSFSVPISGMSNVMSQFEKIEREAHANDL